MPSSEHNLSTDGVWWIILICGLFGLCDGVTYQLSAVPEKVALGQTLTITAELINPTTANTDLRMFLTRSGRQTMNIFHYRTATGCIFLLEPYISTGTVVSCEPANSRYVIRFQSVTAEHVGTYQLSAPLEYPVGSLSQGVAADVQLLVAPTSVTATPSRREVIEGKSTNLLCTVDDQATLPVSFVWKRIINGNRINLPAGSRTAMIPGGRSCKLSWNPVSRQHAGQYECKASNEVGQLTSQPATLVVYYPATSVILSTSTGTTTVSVATSVTFTCTSTGGNPRPGLVFFNLNSGRVLKESVQSSSTRLTYGPAIMQKSSNGAKYRCKTKVNVGAGNVPVKESNTLTMNVQFPPDDIKAPTSVTVDEGQHTTIRCETTTSSNPKTHLTWTGPDVDQRTESESLGAHGGVITGRFVTLIGDRTRNGATYTCTATHLGQQIYTTSTKLDVRFAPEAIASYDTLDTPVLESQERILRCRAETSKPPGTIIWNKIHSGVQSIVTSEPSTEVPGDFGGTVLETSVTIKPSRQDNGAKYWCQVEYTYTNGTEVTRRAPAKVLDVYYPVDVGISVSQGTDNIREGDPITLTCATSGGNPRTIDKYTWAHNENIIVDATERSLSLNPIQYDQGEKYSCSATNKGGTSTTSTDIDVKYKPRLDPSVAHEFEVGEQLGESVVLTLTILANPEPTSVKWTRADGGVFSTSRFLEITNGNINSLQINDITERDYSNYQCQVTNGVGVTNFLFTVISKGPPETPSYLTVTERSSSSLSLQWKPGFGGSSGQIFLLDVITGNEIVQQHEISNTNEPITTFNVKHLTAATEYKFRLQAKNDLDLMSAFTQISSMTKSDISELVISIIRFDKTTVFVDWSKGNHDLFLDYSNASVAVDLTTVRGRQCGIADLTRRREARFSDRKLVINVTEDSLYAYDVAVFDDNRVVLRRENLEAKTSTPPKHPPMVTILISIASGLGACCLTLAVIVAAQCCKLRTRSDATATTRVSTSKIPGQSSTGFHNRAYEDENPYMEPVHHSPEEEWQYSEPGEANPYFYCQGNKYATVGEVGSSQKTDQSSDVRVSDNNATVSSDVKAPPDDYIDMTSQRRAAKACVEEIERSLGVSAGGELRPLSDFRSSLRPDSESEYVQMNRPQSAVAEENA